MLVKVWGGKKLNTFIAILCWRKLSRINPVLTGAEVVDQNVPCCKKFLRFLAFVHLPGQDPILEKVNLVSVCFGRNNEQETDPRQENWIRVTFREVQTNSICSAKVSHSPRASSMHHFKEVHLYLIILLESINIINITCGQFCKFFIVLLPAC